MPSLVFTVSFILCALSQLAAGIADKVNIVSALLHVAVIVDETSPFINTSAPVTIVPGVVLSVNVSLTVRLVASIAPNENPSAPNVLCKTVFTGPFSKLPSEVFTTILTA